MAIPVSLCFLALTALVFHVHAAIINTTLQNGGVIRGTTKEVPIDSRKVDIVEYLGIPFAEPPLGNLRFKHSLLKMLEVNVTIDAFDYGPACLQIKDGLITDEDCLTLNIFTPKTGNNQLYPVMVFIYGGSFVNGYSANFQGHILAAYGDVVLVTMNYRTGAFGFLSTGDATIPGNAGISDQRTALLWVKENIESFGGNSSLVTLFGESAGSASVMYHVLFEKKDLFQKAIAESGAINSFWARSTPEFNYNTAAIIASKLNCSIATDRVKAIKEIVTCLQAVSAQSLLSVSSGLTGWAPTFAKESLQAVEWPVTTDYTGELRSVYQGRDLIIGTNGYEALLFFRYGFKEAIDQMKAAASIAELRLMFRKLVIIQMTPIIPNLPDALVDAIMYLYSNAENPNDLNFNLEQVCNFLSDFYFLLPCYKDTATHAYMNNRTKVYQYEFNRINPAVNRLPGFDWMKGATHAQELPYVFGFPISLKDFISSKNMTQEEIQKEWPTSKTIMDYWTNFAKTGNPNKPRTVVEWKQFTNDGGEFLLFPNSGDAESKTYFQASRMEFWLNYLPQIMKRVTDVTPDKCEPTSASCTISLNHMLMFVVLLLSYVVLK